MFKDLVKQNRSCRGYDKNRKVTFEELSEFVDYARLAPSSANIQPLKYYLVHEQEEVKKVQLLTMWAGGLPELHLPHAGMYPTAFVVICQDLTISKSIPQFQKDVGIVAQTMLLAATEAGLSGCMIGNFGTDKIQKTLGIEAHLSPVLVVAFGKKEENIILTEVEEGDSTKYYRDSEDTHYVPKRKLEDIIVNK